jgi:hypothetical protein
VWLCVSSGLSPTGSSAPKQCWSLAGTRHPAGFAVISAGNQAPLSLQTDLLRAHHCLPVPCLSPLKEQDRDMEGEIRGWRTTQGCLCPPGAVKRGWHNQRASCCTVPSRSIVCRQHTAQGAPPLRRQRPCQNNARWCVRTFGRFLFVVVREDRVFFGDLGWECDLRDTDCCPATHPPPLLVLRRWRLGNHLATGTFTTRRPLRVPSCGVRSQRSCRSNRWSSCRPTQCFYRRSRRPECDTQRLRADVSNLTPPRLSPPAEARLARPEEGCHGSCVPAPATQAQMPH